MLQINTRRKGPMTKLPAGTGTITFFLCIVVPEARQLIQGTVTMTRIPLHCLQVVLITNGPVFTVSCNKCKNSGCYIAACFVLVQV